MIKIFKTLAFFLCSSTVFSQVAISVKSHALFPTQAGTWEAISSTGNQIYNEQGKNSIGYNIGASVKVNMVKGLFLMPELYYTTLQNKFTDPVSNTTLIAKRNSVDLPMLLGYDIFDQYLGIFAGPVASYQLSTNNQFNDFKENAAANFTVGYQFGAQIKFSKIVVSARYEGAFTDKQRQFINNNINQTIRYDNRPSVVMIGAGLSF